MPGSESGKVYLIGAGPGDIELLTLKAVRCIGLADVILLDSLANPEVLHFARADARVIDVGKRAGQRSAEQSFIEQQMVALAGEGLTVARIKGGDPLMFARGGEELQALAEAGIEVEIISGVTSGLGVPAALCIPLTHRDLSHQVIFVTGHGFGKENEPALPPMSGFAGTLVIYMALNNAHRMVSRLIELGLSEQTPMAAIQAGTTSQQRSVFATLGEFTEKLRQAGLSSPVLIVVGEVVKLSPHFNTRQVLCEVAP